MGQGNPSVAEPQPADSVSLDVVDPLTQLAEGNVCRVRKTTESPPRVSIYDVIGSFGVANPRDAWSALCQSHPECVGLADAFKFPGRGGQVTPVTHARGILRIIMLLPCRAAAPVRALSWRRSVPLASALSAHSGARLCIQLHERRMP